MISLLITLIFTTLIKKLMFISDFCGSTESAQKRRHYLNQRKLEMLIYYKDSLERRIAAITASINTLENQINRDNTEQI